MNCRANRVTSSEARFFPSIPPNSSLIQLNPLNRKILADRLRWINNRLRAKNKSMAINNWLVRLPNGSVCIFMGNRASAGQWVTTESLWYKLYCTKQSNDEQYRCLGWRYSHNLMNSHWTATLSLNRNTTHCGVHSDPPCLTRGLPMRWSAAFLIVPSMSLTEWRRSVYFTVQILT